MKNPKISVIMSVHNGMPYLKEATESILNQTYKNFEFIVVDDASDDNSLKYLSSIKDKRVKIIRNKKNIGLASSLNRALLLAKGDFIARMDADDISKPKRLEIQLHFLNNHPTTDICGLWVSLINEEGNIIGSKKFPKSDINIKKLLNWRSPIIHPTLMAKKNFFKNLGGYDKDFDMAEDYELLLRAKKNYKMANIPQKLLMWRYWNKRRSRTSIQKMGAVDLKVKRMAVNLYGISPATMLPLIKQLISVYVVPVKIKLVIIKIFKLT